MGMKIIVGLGNPGARYATTRHNAGFLAIDAFLKDHPGIQCQSKFASEICEIHFGTIKTFVVKPQTFMNESGRAVRELLQFYKADPRTDLLVIHDEVDLPFGTVRMAADSSAAGHNGVQDIIDKLGTQEFRRVRSGVDARQSRNDFPTENYVLSPFTDDELSRLHSEILPLVSKEIQDFINKS
jgi:PTH1 family peptidyl-tRNA hydrolase